MISLKTKIAGKDITLKFHPNPHHDEHFAWWLLKKFGTREFLRQYAPDGIIKIGVGGGPFDEHPDLNDTRRKEECAATLVAKVLKIDDRFELKRLLGFVLNRDLHGPAYLDLAFITNLFRRKFPDNPEIVFREISRIFELEYQRQVRICNIAGKEYRENADIKDVTIDEEGKTRRIVTITSNLKEDMIAYFRLAERGREAILILKESSGHTSIFVNNIHIAILDDIVGMLRCAVLKQKIAVPPSDSRILKKEGKIEGAEEIYYHRSGRAIINGGRSAPNAPRILLSLKIIQQIVRIGVNPNLFEVSRSHDCKKGFCTASRSNPCPWYPWRLSRCWKVRKRSSY
jgi:hypothetical protein